MFPQSIHIIRKENKKVKIKKVDKYERFHKIDKDFKQETVRKKGICLNCLKPRFKNKGKCGACLKKDRLKRKANSRGKPKNYWEEYK